MAIVSGMRFVKGRLGDVGFRQQSVKSGKGTYKKSTVAFQIAQTVSNPNTPGQERQRIKFKLVQSLATALTNAGILKPFYRSPSGLSGYNKFIQDNVLKAMTESAGVPFVSFPNLKIAGGDFMKEITGYQSLAPATDDCHFSVKLNWNYSCAKDPMGDYYLLLVGIKINEDGAIEGVETVQPMINMKDCKTDVQLPVCSCCKTYWYGFFVDPYTGYFSTSSYIGTESTTYGVFDELSCCVNCAPCDDATTVPVPPTDEKDACGCGDKPAVDRDSIVFNGDSVYDNNGDVNPIKLIVPTTADDDPNMVECYSSKVSTFRLITARMDDGGPGSTVEIETDGLTVSYDINPDTGNAAQFESNLTAAFSKAGMVVEVANVVAIADGNPGFEFTFRYVGDGVFDISVPEGSLAKLANIQRFNGITVDVPGADSALVNVDLIDSATSTVLSSGAVLPIEWTGAESEMLPASIKVQISSTGDCKNLDFEYQIDDQGLRYAI